MKSITKKCLLSLAALSLSLAGTAKTVTMTKATLADKIKGGWAGQTIGCAYGGPTEFKYKACIIPDTVTIPWSKDRVKYYFDKFPGLYDDIYMDLTFVDVFEKKGLDATAADFGDAYAHAGYPLWHANQSGRYNILQGMSPTESGYWKNNPHADDIDFQIEADFSGLMAPGMPNAAAALGDKVGHIMNYGDGWYGGVYVGAMYALAFVSNDVNYVVNEALKTIPQQSEFYKCIQLVLDGYKAYPNDWKKTWQMVQDKYGLASVCPDGVKASFNIDAKLNSAYVVIGLLYGQGDYTRTLDISTRCGQDSDCNPSTAGGILGTMIGYNNIPENWRCSLENVEDTPFAHTDISLNKVYELSLKHALQVISRYGGKVQKNSVKINVQKPTAVRYEKSFDGIEPYAKRGLRNKPIDQVGEIKFNGCGIVVRGVLNADDKNYVGLVDVYIDGKKMKTMPLPAASNARSNDIYWNFDLEEGDHVLTMKRVNPQDNVKSKVYSVILYRKQK